MINYQMPKYHIVNSREERCRKRDINNQISSLKSSIFKKNNFIVELKKKVDNAYSANNYLDNTYKFLYNTYCRLYNDFKELSESYNQLKNDKEDIEKKYKELLDEFVQKEILNENENINYTRRVTIL